MRARVLFTCLLSLLFILPAASVAADDAVAWTVAAGDDGSGRPNFVYEAKPGQVIEDTWVVGNAGTEPVTLQVYAADALTTASGQLDLEPVSQPPVGVGAWVSLSSPQLTLEPGQQIVVPFTLTVPADVLPGDHAGGLVTAMVDDSSGTLQLERRLATRIHVRIPGELETSMSSPVLEVEAPRAWHPFEPVSLRAAYGLTNSGTARAFAYESLRVTGPGGLAAVAVAGQVGEILPGSTVDRTVEVPGVWALGPMTVQLEVRPEGIDGSAGEPVVLETTIWVVPWGWVLLLGVVVLGGIGAGVLRGRRSPMVEPSSSVVG